MRRRDLGWLNFRLPRPAGGRRNLQHRHGGARSLWRRLSNHWLGSSRWRGSGNWRQGNARGDRRIDALKLAVARSVGIPRSHAGRHL